MKLYKCTASQTREDGRTNKVQVFIEAVDAQGAEAICFEYFGDKFGDFTVTHTRTKKAQAQ